MLDIMGRVMQPVGAAYMWGRYGSMINGNGLYGVVWPCYASATPSRASVSPCLGFEALIIKQDAQVYS